MTVKKQIRVILKKSKIESTERQKQTLIGLGLKKISSAKLLNDTPQVRGMIRKVSHLVSVEGE
ncbi:MAG: 50S ribosomal protein L30 [Deltaproteobacteria bacterium]|nr:50S ribosomal protein L30 [Deltaproteobacteria bacterium]